MVADTHVRVSIHYKSNALTRTCLVCNFFHAGELQYSTWHVASNSNSHVSMLPQVDVGFVLTSAAVDRLALMTLLGRLD